MSCADGKNCNEAKKRRRGIIVLGLMIMIFIILSGFSFLGSRGRANPDAISFGAHQAADGKRVFQAYNCMGCHTMVGNGAYLAPDLTKEYTTAGPAWLAAFLPSAAGWPTEAAVRTQLTNSDVAADAGVDNIEDYYKKFPGARERVERRGGGTTLMPNLAFSSDEVGQLIAFMKYSAAMNTEGWPPEVQTGSLERRLALLNGGSHMLATATAASAPVAEGASATPADPVARGEELTKEYACTACHALDDKRMVGPGWGGLYGSRVKLADGSTVTADDTYLIDAVNAPDKQIVEGFPPGVMPKYDTLLKDDDVKAIVAYIKSLEKP